MVLQFFIRLAVLPSVAVTDVPAFVLETHHCRRHAGTEKCRLRSMLSPANRITKAASYPEPQTQTLNPKLQTLSPKP